MTQVNSGISEPNSGKGAGKMHLRPRLHIVWGKDGPLEVFLDDPQGVFGPDIRYGVAALVGGAVEWVGGARGPLGVVDGGVRLEGVAEDIETGESRHSLWHVKRVEGIHETKKGAEGAVGDAGLGMSFFKVENGHSCRLTASPRCRRY